MNTTYCHHFFVDGWTPYQGKSYYVDFTGGNDASNGLSQASAWKTIAKVNGWSFHPGDTVLFKRGETWTGTELNIIWSGLPGKEITFGAYGVGARPIIDGNDLAGCIEINGQSYINLEDLVAYQGNAPGIYIRNYSHNINLTNVDASDCANDGLLFIDNCYDCYVKYGRFHLSYQPAAYRVTGIEIADGCHDITIDSVEADNNQDNAAGIAVFSHALADDVLPWNITIKNSNIHDNAVYALLVAKQDPNPRNGVTVYLQNNTITGTIFSQGDVEIVYL